MLLVVVLYAKHFITKIARVVMMSDDPTSSLLYVFNVLKHTVNEKLPMYKSCRLAR